MPYPHEDMTQMIKDFIEDNGLCEVLGAMSLACSEIAKQKKASAKKNNLRSWVAPRAYEDAAHLIYVMERGQNHHENISGFKC